MRLISQFCDLNNLDTKRNIKWKVVNVRSSGKGTLLGKQELAWGLGTEAGTVSEMGAW